MSDFSGKKEEEAEEAEGQQLGIGSPDGRGDRGALRRLGPGSGLRVRLRKPI